MLGFDHSDLTMERDSDLDPDFQMEFADSVPHDPQIQQAADLSKKINEVNKFVVTIGE